MFFFTAKGSTRNVSSTHTEHAHEFILNLCANTFCSSENKKRFMISLHVYRWLYEDFGINKAEKMVKLIQAMIDRWRWEIDPWFRKDSSKYLLVPKIDWNFYWKRIVSIYRSYQIENNIFLAHSFNWRTICCINMTNRGKLHETT